MLKRFYSKRSGFTLVEIVVAFAVFAIMASMIVQILDLSVKARTYNVKYQADLDVQEKYLSLVEKNSGNFKKDDPGNGTIILEFSNGQKVELPYSRMGSVLDSDLDGDGIAYFLSPVNYQAEGEIAPSAGAGTGTGAGGEGVGTTGSQTMRMDTRLTGTAGIDYISIQEVVKEQPHTYAANDPYYLAPGNTRYYFRVSVSAGSMHSEDIPYSQIRMYFYHMPANATDKDYLDQAASSVEYTDEDGKKYTKDVNKTAKIVNIGYLKDHSKIAAAAANGLSSDYAASSYSTNNPYTVEHTGGNIVRIGTPFDSVKAFGSTSTFYIDFEGDPHLTTESFGSGAKPQSSGNVWYSAFPIYPEELTQKYFDSNGKFIYNDKDATNYGTHVNIYGAYIQPRHYK